jgi:tetraacyldisaccharide 4'-kinase
MSIEQVWYGRSAASIVARAALTPLSFLFAGGVRARGAAYDGGLLRSVRAPGPVVSVGGLRVGGSGKTPFVLWLATALRRRGLSPCLVTSGYGGRGRGRTPKLLLPSVPDAATVAEVGDEAALLAWRSGCPVAVGRDRRAACLLARRELEGQGAGPDLFLLDDGFQHRALVRDLDIVLTDGREEFERLLPAGPLREGHEALDRADVLVALGEGASLPVLADDRLVLRAEARPSMLVASVGDESGEDLSRLAGCRVAAVAAIARPERFLADLERLGAKVESLVLRRDHHRYEAADLREIAAAAAKADLVVTTEKDLVKLSASGIDGLRALRLDLRVHGGEVLTERIAALARGPRPAFDR